MVDLIRPMAPLLSLIGANNSQDEETISEIEEPYCKAYILDIYRVTVCNVVAQSIAVLAASFIGK